MKKNRFLLVVPGIVCLFVACELVQQKHFPTVIQTESGKVEGVLGKTSLYFKGVPYAEPPMGDLRWQPPADKTPWEDVLQAQEFSNACPQVPPVYVQEEVLWDEDCLCLNIYRPRENTQNLPVMVFIHGGGFRDGASSLSTYDGEWLAQNKKIVLVTINYRLNIFGFLYLPETGITGNYGIQDQIKALEWVNNNIASFGGDPENITVFGESAGGISVGLLQGLRPDLFNKAIIQSGFITCNADEMDAANASKIGWQLVQKFGCTAADDIAECLRAKPVAELLSAAGNIDLSLSENNRQYWPVIDGDFISDTPQELILKGAGRNIPLIMGVNADEGTVFALALEIQTENDYESWVYSSFPDHAEKVLALYPLAEYATPQLAASAIVGDVIFVCPTRRALVELAQYNTLLYQYYFTYPPLRTRPVDLGAHHGAELAYIFHTFSEHTRAARQVSRNIATLWTSFASEGVPSADTILWPSFSSSLQQYLIIDQELAVDTDLNRLKCDFWDGMEQLSCSDDNNTVISDLVNKQWVLHSFDSPSDNESVIPGTEITLLLNDDGTLQGSGGCNSFSGDFTTAEDGTMAVINLTWTDMSCEFPQGIMQQEESYLSALGTVNGFADDETSLTLLYNAAGYSLDFSVMQKSSIVVTIDDQAETLELTRPVTLPINRTDANFIMTECVLKTWCSCSGPLELHDGYWRHHCCDDYPNCEIKIEIATGNVVCSLFG